MIVISDTTPIVSLIKIKLRNSSIRLSDSLIQEALSMLE